MADTPYVLDLPAMTGDVAQTLVQLRKTRLEITVNPRPNYQCHGESFRWQDMYDWLNRAIDACQKELIALQPWEMISAAR